MCADAAMPAKSAPMLNVFATMTSAASANASQRGKSFRITAARPTPVTIPMRAHMPCTTAIIGVVISASHSIDSPVVAPATEYVEMPEGSSSAAPVMMPGPRFRRKWTTRFPSAALTEVAYPACYHPKGSAELGGSDGIGAAQRGIAPRPQRDHGQGGDAAQDDGRSRTDERGERPRLELAQLVAGDDEHAFDRVDAPAHVVRRAERDECVADRHAHHVGGAQQHQRRDCDPERRRKPERDRGGAEARDGAEEPRPGEAM